MVIDIHFCNAFKQLVSALSAHRLYSGGVPCPEVVLLRKHILVMSFIGRDQKPAPTLKEAVLTSEQMNSAYQQCLQVGGVRGKRREGKEKDNLLCVGMYMHVCICMYMCCVHV